MDLKKNLIEVAIYSTGIAAAFLVAGLFLAFLGHDAIKAFQTLLFTPFNSAMGVRLTVQKFIPLLLMGLGFAVPLMARKYNVGVEGQFLLGAIGAVTLAFTIGSLLPAPLLITLMVISSIVFGMVWAVIPAVLLYKFGVNEIISTILLNFISFYLVDFVATGPWRDSFAGHPMTLPIPEQGILPVIIRTPPLNVGVVIALIFPFLAFFYIYRTVSGYELRATGANSRASAVFGINAKYIGPLSLVLGGMLAGLAGGLEVTGLHHRLVGGMHSNYGALAILVALICRGNPIGVILTSLFISIVEIGADAMQRTMGVPVELVLIVQSMILLFVLLTDVIMGRKRW